jgi:superfamily II DNA or RNA helicase
LSLFSKNALIRSKTLEASAAVSPPQPKLSTWCAKLLPPQACALDFLLQRLQNGGGAGLYSEQGTGKGYISLALLETLAPVLDNILIVCPLTALDDAWADRIGQGLFRTLPYVVVRTWEDFKRAHKWPLVSRSRPPSLTKATGSKSSPGKPAATEAKPKIILLAHFQLFSKIASRMANHPNLWDMVIIDEAQGLKSRGSGWSRAARKFRGSKRRLVLSGTPIDKSPIDVWAQMRFIDHTVLNEDWTPFAERFCVRGGYGGHKWIFRQHKLPEFLSLIEPCCYRLSKQFMQLPPLIIHPVPVELLGEQASIYKAMDEDNIVTVKGIKFIADLEITKKIRLQQITSGFLQNDDAIVTVGHAKERKLASLLSKLKPPIVVFCKFLEELETIERAVDKVKNLNAAVLLHGKVKGEMRSDVIRRFKTGKIDLLACQMRTGGVGIDLSAASNIVAYSLNYSFIDFEQFLSRLHRGGQSREVHAYVIYATDTEDERIMDIVNAKQGEAYKVMGHLEQAHGA